jgi:hypothetical protein
MGTQQPPRNAIPECPERSGQLTSTRTPVQTPTGRSSGCSGKGSASMDRATCQPGGGSRDRMSDTGAVRGPCLLNDWGVRDVVIDL